LSEIIAKKQRNVKNNTCLCIKFFENIVEHIGNVVPFPHRHFFHREGYVYCWLIDGFFKTKKGIEFINDIIARFKLTFDCKLFNLKSVKNDNNPYKLKQFQNLKSKAIKHKDYLRADVQYDTVFWVLKYYAEDLIKEDGFIVYQKLEAFAVENFLDAAKDFSTLKAKCRSVYKWYLERDWEIGRLNKKFNNKGELMASRIEHMKKVNKERAAKTKRKVLSCITGMFSFEYKKKNGDWNISKIAKDAGVARNTVYKYLKQLKENGIID